MDNIAFGSAFYSLRTPAWHSLGTVSQEEKYAVEAMNGVIDFDIEVKQLTTAEGIEIPMRGIFRTATPADPQARFLGAVGMEYESISPLQICEIYDRTVNAPVETMGALGQGETMFLTTKMPQSSTIVTDEIQHYLLIDAPLAGNQALYVRNVDVRVVCWNTLMIARERSVQSYRIRHEKGAAERLEEWMGGVYAQAEQNVRLIDQFFGLMAAHSPNDEQVATVLHRTYPNPKQPRRDAPPTVMESREQTYEYNLLYQSRQRDLVMELFSGAGTGMDSQAAKGTFWGLYNAVVELEDYRGTNRSGVARQRDALFGYRAEVKETAFSAVMDELPK